MTEPETMPETIYQALAKVQAEMPVIGRNKTANVGKFSYSYADLEKIWEIARPIIEKHGFTVYNCGDGDKVVTVVVHTSGEKLLSAMNISQVDPQKKGGEVTYYRRYNLCMLFNIIVAEEDKDAVGTGEVNEEKLAMIEGELSLLNTVEELSNYHKQLGTPKDKATLALFTARKKAL